MTTPSETPLPPPSGAQPPTPPVPPAAAAPRPPRAPAGDPRGSLGLGIGLAWACLIGGYTIVGFLFALLESAQAGSGRDLFQVIAVLLLFVPWVAMIALIVWLAATGSPRTAAGVGVGIASIFGVALLLVAACFGILSTTNFH